MWKSGMKICSLNYGINFRWLPKSLICRFYSSDSNNFTKWPQPNGYQTDISIYNTLTKQNEPLILKDEGIVKWYTCGPTVYDSAHIGHACCYMKFDIIRRILENFFNLKVFYLMGITDIDDKIIVRANIADENFADLAKRYEIEFFSDLAKLNILPPTASARVSDHISNIIHFIQTLMRKGLGYGAPDGSVYFDTMSYGRYGKFHQTPEESLSEPNSPYKKHPLDFALWKGVKPNEPSWDTPWGKGRPGWHIECSTIASKYFGSQVDIHSGGIDLFFPHHEDEEAQCCAFHGISQWVNYWIHSGHLFLKNNVKMSKSLKNTITVDQLLEKYTALDFRFLCLLSRYRNNLEYDSEMMLKAVTLRKKFETFLENSDDYVRNFKNLRTYDEVKLLKALQKTEDSVRSSLACDFNTVKMMSHLTDLISLTNSMIQSDSSSSSDGQSPVVVSYVAQYVRKTMSLLGAEFNNAQQNTNDSMHLVEEIVALSVGFRSQVRDVAIAILKQKEITQPDQLKLLLQICDQFRGDFSKAGIVIKDHKDRSAWSLKSKTGS